MKFKPRIPCSPKIVHPALEVNKRKINRMKHFLKIISPSFLNYYFVCWCIFKRGRHQSYCHGCHILPYTDALLMPLAIYPHLKSPALRENVVILSIKKNTKVTVGIVKQGSVLTTLEKSRQTEHRGCLNRSSIRFTLWSMQGLQWF